MTKTMPSIGIALAGLSLGLCAGSAPAARAQGPSTDVQHQAMQKLAFLEGQWSGPVTIIRGPGEPLKATQTEDIQYKLDGLVLLIEGKSTGPDGKVGFSALATIAYDESTKTYRFRAYNQGHYVDTELAVTGNGFSWSYAAGPAHISNTMKLTDKGEWQEWTEVDIGSGPPHKVVDMLLTRQH